MKKIFWLVMLLTTMVFSQARYNPYTTEGWDVPWGFTGQDSSITPSWSSSLGYYGLGIMEINTNPGGWLNYNYWKIDSLLQALVVYTDTSFIIVRNDTLTLADHIAAHWDSTFSTYWFDMDPIHPDSVPFREARFYYDSEGKSFNVIVEEPDVTMNLGREMWIRGYNNTGGTIANGTPLYGNPINVGQFELAKSADDSTSHIVGVATHSIEDGTFGYATSYGAVNDVNTSALSLGPIYLGATGGLVSVKPSAPNNTVAIGACGYVHATEGVIFVEWAGHFNSINGIASISFETESEVIDATSNVQVTNATGDLFIYNSAIGHDISVSGDTVYVAEAGVYQFSTTISFGGGNGGLYKFTLKDGGTTIPNYAARRKTTSADVGSLALVVIHELDAGDYITLWVEDIGTSPNITMVDCSMAIVQVR